MINYITMFIGIIVVLISTIIIFLDRIKGEDIYFNIDFKEQELKKVIEDADELIAELNFTSEAIVKQIEDKIDLIDKHQNNIDIEAHKDCKFDNKGIYTYKYKKPSKGSILKDDKQKHHIKDKIKEQDHDNHFNDKHGKVIKHFKDGFSIEDIARAENMGKGEVQLILSLRKDGEKDEYI